MSAADVSDGPVSDSPVSHSPVSDSPFSPAVVEAILGHMNSEHNEDSRVICRAFGPSRDAVAAELEGFDEAGMVFSVDTGAGTESFLLPWTEPIEERADIRADIVRRYHSAREVLGLGPAEQH